MLSIFTVIYHLSVSPSSLARGACHMLRLQVLLVLGNDDGHVSVLISYSAVIAEAINCFDESDSDFADYLSAYDFSGE